MNDQLTINNEASKNHSKWSMANALKIENCKLIIANPEGVA
jgi:hypothetical protein